MLWRYGVAAHQARMSVLCQKRTSAVLLIAAGAPLPQRDDQPVEVGGDNQPGLAARQRQHRAVLVG